MQTEKAKSSHFDRTRGFKNQIFPTLTLSQPRGADYAHQTLAPPDFQTFLPGLHPTAQYKQS